MPFSGRVRKLGHAAVLHCLDCFRFYFPPFLCFCFAVICLSFLLRIYLVNHRFAPPRIAVWHSTHFRSKITSAYRHIICFFFSLALNSKYPLFDFCDDDGNNCNGTIPGRQFSRSKMMTCMRLATLERMAEATPWLRSRAAVVHRF